MEVKNLSECEFKKRIYEKFVWLADANEEEGTVDYRKIFAVVDEVYKEYPKVSQKWVPTKGNRVDWRTLCLQMEQKIIEFENFGKKWFGESKNDSCL